MKTLYEQVYESIKEDIISAKYSIGERLPTEKDIARSFKVSLITSKKALEKLVNEGYIYRQRGKGSFVASLNQENHQSNNSHPNKPLFGLVLTNFGDSFGTGLVEAIEEESHGKCMIILKRSLGIPEREEEVVKELLEFGVDGLIVFPAKSERYSSEILKMVVNKFPFVLIDRSFKGIAAPSISTDNYEGSRVGIKYLHEIGHNEIGVLMPKDVETTTIEDRLSGIVSAFAELQISVNKKYWCDTIQREFETKEKDIEIIKQYFQSNPKITAVFTLEYSIAKLTKIALEQLGKKIPDDVSVLTFDSPPLEDSEWRFTHLKQDEFGIGKRAVKSLLKIYYKDNELNKKQIKAKLELGESTKPLNVSNLRETN